MELKRIVLNNGTVLTNRIVEEKDSNHYLIKYFTDEDWVVIHKEGIKKVEDI